MQKTAIALALSAAMVGAAFAGDETHGRIPHLDYAFVMENYPLNQIIGNSAAPFIKKYAKEANLAQGDAAVQALVTQIRKSPVWTSGRSAIIVVWDENHYSSKPNQVVTIVDTNYGVKGVTSHVKYNHFSLVKTLEAGFGLEYLNHAADKDVRLISDLFSRD